MAAKTRKRREPAVTYPDIKPAADELLSKHEAGEVDDADLLARFDHFAQRYSPRNAALILSQDPQATEVNGFWAWKDLGRRVRKGEHGIRILAPAGSYTDGDKPAAAGGDKRPAGGEQEQEVRMRFRLATVFDVRQTDPSPPPGDPDGTVGCDGGPDRQAER